MLSLQRVVRTIPTKSTMSYASHLSLEELYYKIIPFDNSLNFDVYHDGLNHICKCGNKSSEANGFFYSNTGKFEKFKCTKCGHETRSKNNLLSKEKKATLLTDSVKA